MDKTQSQQDSSSKSYQPIPAYTAADYGTLFRCYPEEVRLLKRLRDLRKQGHELVMVNVDAMTLQLVAMDVVEQYGRLEDKLRGV